MNRQEAEEKLTNDQRWRATEQENTLQLWHQENTLCSHPLYVLFLAALCIESYSNLLFQPLRKRLALNHILIRQKKGIKTHTAPQASRKATWFHLIGWEGFLATHSEKLTSLKRNGRGLGSKLSKYFIWLHIKVSGWIFPGKSHASMKSSFILTLNLQLFDISRGFFWLLFDFLKTLTFCPRFLVSALLTLSDKDDKSDPPHPQLIP